MQEDFYWFHGGKMFQLLGFPICKKVQMFSILSKGTQLVSSEVATITIFTTLNLCSLTILLKESKNKYDPIKHQQCRGCYCWAMAPGVSDSECMSLCLIGRRHFTGRAPPSCCWLTERQALESPSQPCVKHAHAHAHTHKRARQLYGSLQRNKGGLFASVEGQCSSNDASLLTSV